MTNFKSRGELRVLVLLPGHDLFGQEKATIGLGRILQESGASVHFLLHSQWGKEKLGKLLTELGFSWSALPLGTLWSKLLFRRRPFLLITNLVAVCLASLSLIKISQSFKPHYLLVGNWSFTLFLLPALVFTSVKVVYRHGDLPPNHTVFHRLLIRILFRQVHTHVANCHFVAHGVKNAFPKGTPRVIYNLGSVPPRNGRLRRELSSTGGFNVVFVGQLTENKGVILLLKAFELLLTQHPHARLHIVGGAPGVGECKSINVESLVQKYVKSYPGQILWHGLVANPSSLYKLAHIHVCPSIWPDPSPNVIFEAKANGLPSIVFPVGGIPELVEHLQDGYICNPISVESLASGIAYFIEHPERLYIASDNAHAKYEREYGKDRYVAEWMDVFLCRTPMRFQEAVGVQSGSQPHS